MFLISGQLSGALLPCSPSEVGLGQVDDEKDCRCNGGGSQIRQCQSEHGSQDTSSKFLLSFLKPVDSVKYKVTFIPQSSVNVFG